MEKGLETAVLSFLILPWLGLIGELCLQVVTGTRVLTDGRPGG